MPSAPVSKPRQERIFGSYESRIADSPHLRNRHFRQAAALVLRQSWQSASADRKAAAVPANSPR